MNNRKINENIESFLKDNYLKEDITGFGILIDGKWGCGKTHLIDKIVKSTEIKYYKISVYGLTTLEQLHSKVYEKLHPILTSKAVKISSSVLKGLIKGTLHYDFDNDDKEDLSIELPLAQIASDDFDKDINLKKVIIVDDLERCSIPADQIFGFFSEYIIEKNAKVIFICNQDELKKKYKIEKTANNETTNDEYTEKYLAIKEKVIGVEFFVKPDYDEALQSFVSDFQLENIKDDLIKITKEVMKFYQIENLRIIRQAFYYIRILFNSLKDCEKFDLIIFRDIIKYFEILFIKKTEGKLLSSNDIRKYISEYQNEISLLTINKKLVEYIKVPFETIYYDIIVKGDFDKELLLKEFNKWIIPEKNTNYLQVLTHQWRNLSDKEFKEYFKLLEKNVSKGKLDSYMSLWEYAELLQELSETGIILKSKKDIEDVIRKYIEKNKDNLIANILPEEINEMLYYDEYEYSPLASCNDIVNLIVDSSIEKTKNNIRNEVKSICSDLNKNLDKFYDYIQSYLNPDYESAIYSIFEFITIKDFYKQLKKLTFKQQMEVYNKFLLVYRELAHNASVNVYNSIIPIESEKINELSKLYAKDSEPDTIMSPEKYSKKILAKNYSDMYNKLTTNSNDL